MADTMMIDHGPCLSNHFPVNGRIKVETIALIRKNRKICANPFCSPKELRM